MGNKLDSRRRVLLVAVGLAAVMRLVAAPQPWSELVLERSKDACCLQLPADAGAATDILIALHDRGTNRWECRESARDEYVAIRELAATRGMVLAAPDGTGPCNWMGPAAEKALAELIGQLRAAHPQGRVFLAGAGMGGTAALAFTARRNDLIAGVTAFNPIADQVAFEGFQSEIAAAFGGNKLDFDWQYEYRSPGRWVSHFDMPVSITVGGRDTVMPPDSARTFAARVRARRPGGMYLDDAPERGHATELAAARRALAEMVAKADARRDPASVKTVELCVRVPKGVKNPCPAALAEYGISGEDGGFRVMCNAARDLSVSIYRGSARVKSRAWVLADGDWHHIAATFRNDGTMELFVDGQSEGRERSDARGFARGGLTVGERDGLPSEWRDLRRRLNPFQRFTGFIGGVKLYDGEFDPATTPKGEPANAVRQVGYPEGPVSTWERPKTTRRYLQGPFSERVLTYWREGKILLGEVEHRPDWAVDNDELLGHALWLVRGPEDEPFDFKAAELSVSDEGIPDHAQTWREGPFEVTLAACSPFARRSTAFGRLTVKNVGSAAARGEFAFLVRKARQRQLVFDAPDVYRIYRPTIDQWRRLAATDWRQDGRTLWTEDGRFVAFDRALGWDAAKGAARWSVKLAPGEVQTVDWALGKGELPTATYAEALAQTRSDWRRELARARLPQFADARLVRNLAAQMLQFLARPTAGDFVLPRQGGMQNYVWPGEVINYLPALDLLGYADYARKVMDFYFQECQQPSGELGPFRRRWATDTAMVIETFARHCLMTDDAATWQRYVESAERACGWANARREPDGLMPVLSATDANVFLRHWANTDIRFWCAFDQFARAAAHFGDSRAAAARARADDYRAALVKVLDRLRREQQGRDELVLPYSADGKDEDVFMSQWFFYCHPDKVAETGLLTPSEVERVERGMIRRGFIDPEHALTMHNPMQDFELRDHVWYTTSTELGWFRAWMRLGRRDKAQRLLESMLKFAVTDEYLVGERYDDANPWFYPWSPNASGNGRILEMIFALADGND